MRPADSAGACVPLAEPFSKPVRRQQVRQAAPRWPAVLLAASRTSVPDRPTTVWPTRRGGPVPDPQHPRTRRASAVRPSCCTPTMLRGSEDGPEARSVIQRLPPQQVIQHRKALHGSPASRAPASSGCRLGRRLRPACRRRRRVAPGCRYPASHRLRRRHAPAGRQSGGTPSRPPHMHAPSRRTPQPPALDPVVRAHVDHHTAAIGQPGEVIGGVAALFAFRARPGQPEQLDENAVTSGSKSSIIATSRSTHDSYPTWRPFVADHQ